MTTNHSPDSDTASLQNLAVPIPCTESWDAMQGDERVRHCGLCRKNVHNLSAMSQAEVTSLLAGKADGELCVRFYRRSDGTVMTADCSTSQRVKLHRAMRTLPRAVAGVAGATGAAAAIAVAVAHAMPGVPARSGSEPYVVEVSLLEEPFLGAPVVGVVAVPEHVTMGVPVFGPEPVRPVEPIRRVELQAVELQAVELQAVEPVPADAGADPEVATDDDVVAPSS